MMELIIPVTEEWNHGFKATPSFPYSRRTFRRHLDGRDDFVTFSEPYSREFGEPVWFYSWGNSRWLRCPMGLPGDKLNSADDRIRAVDVKMLSGVWHFVITVQEARL